MRLAWVLVSGVCLCFPTVVDGQDPDFASRLDAPTLAAVRPILNAAARDSLPMQALQSKILEGLAKNVPSGQIGQVVAGLAESACRQHAPRIRRTALRSSLPRLPASFEPPVTS